MYDNISGKIKILAWAEFIVATFVSELASIGLLATSDQNSMMIGLFGMILSPVVAWAASLVTYGFGELIDKAIHIAQNTYSEKEELEEVSEEVEWERMRKIERLRSQGLLTEEEYQAKRAEIISKL